MGIFGGVSKDLRDRLMNEGASKSRANDPRFLPYFNLKEGEQIEILLLPDGDGSGEFFRGYKNHSAPGVFGLGTINCSYSSSGEPCAVCAHGYELYKAGQLESREWMASQHYVAQCLVISAPAGFEIPESPDGNLVKLLHLPIAVKEMAKDAIINETLDDPTAHILVLKRTKKNKGNFMTYEKSFFKNSTVSEDDLPNAILKGIDDGHVVPYKLSDELPAPTTSVEMEAWLVKALSGGMKKQPETTAQQGQEVVSLEAKAQMETRVTAQVPAAEMATTKPEAVEKAAEPERKLTLQERIALRAKKT